MTTVATGTDSVGCSAELLELSLRRYRHVACPDPVEQRAVRLRRVAPFRLGGPLRVNIDAPRDAQLDYPADGLAVLDLRHLIAEDQQQVVVAVLPPSADCP